MWTHSNCLLWYRSGLLLIACTFLKTVLFFYVAVQDNLYVEFWQNVVIRIVCYFFYFWYFSIYTFVFLISHMRYSEQPLSLLTLSSYFWNQTRLMWQCSPYGHFIKDISRMISSFMYQVKINCGISSMCHRNIATEVRKT